MAHRVLVVNGPNLNTLGSRQPDIYGQTTLADIERMLTELAGTAPQAIDLRFVQSNHEGELIDAIQEHGPQATAMIINLGGLTHTSVALRDALVATGRPVVEVHLSNIYAREDFRHHSYIAPISVGQIAGFGAEGYAMALRYVIENVLSGAGSA